MIARSCILVAAAALLGAAPAACQGGGREIGPGSPELSPGAVRERTDTLDMLAVQGGATPVAATLVLRISAGEKPGTLTRVERITGEGGALFYLDSSTVERATLAPLAAHTRDRFGTRTLSWETGWVRGRDPVGDSIAEPLGAPAFYGNSADLVLAALPLADGYEATVRFSGGEAGNGPIRVRVSAREEVATMDGGRCRAWRVEVAGSGRSGSYWIGDDRALVRFDSGGRARTLRRKWCGAAGPLGRASRR